MLFQTNLILTLFLSLLTIQLHACLAQQDPPFLQSRPATSLPHNLENRLIQPQSTQNVF